MATAKKTRAKKSVAVPVQAPMPSATNASVIIGLIGSLVSFLSIFLIFLNSPVVLLGVPFAGITGIAAIWLALEGRRVDPSWGEWKTGLILGIISLGAAVLMLIAYFVLISILLQGW